MTKSSAAQLTLLFDGGCPLCVREVRFLERRDRVRRIRFVDIDAADYNPAVHGGIGYREAIKQIVDKDGVLGLFTRGLGTRVLTNAIQASLFSVVWKYLEGRMNA